MALELFETEDGHRAALIGSRCRACAYVSFPSRPVCARCGTEDIARERVGRRGRIVSSSVVHHAPIGFQAPYVVALVQLDEGPTVFCPITDCAADETLVPPGAAVELVVAPARPGGAPVFQFRPIATS
jgi:uncharacterized OB-fold protein